MSLTKSNKLNLFLSSLLLTCSGFFISHQLIYKLLILPQLWKWGHIPLVWWLLLLLLPLSSWIFIGARIRSLPDFGLTVLGSIVATILVTYILLVLGEPGLGHDIELTSDITFGVLGLQLLFVSTSYVMIYGVIWFINKCIHRAQQPKNGGCA